MSYVHLVTFKCDSCEKEHMIDEEMEMPPYWFGVQMAIADQDGMIPSHEREEYLHFCEQKCLFDFCIGKELKSRFLLVDKKIEDEERPEERPEEEV